jgi:hypothetical protein
MSETARFTDKMVRHQLHIWEIGGAVVFGLAVGVVSWAIASSRDLVAVIGDALTFLEPDGPPYQVLLSRLRPDPRWSN